MKCPRCGKENMDHICEMGACDFEFNIYWHDLDTETQNNIRNAAIDEGFEIPQAVLDSKEPVAVEFKGII